MLKGIPLIAGATGFYVLRLGIALGLMGVGAGTTAAVGWIPLVGQVLAGGTWAAGIVIGSVINTCLLLCFNAFITTLFYMTYGSRQGLLKGRMEAMILRRIIIRFCAALIPIVNLLPWEVVTTALSIRDVHKHSQNGRAASEGNIETAEEGEPASAYGEFMEEERAPMRPQRQPVPVATYQTPAEEKSVEERAPRAPLLNADIRPRADNDNLPRTYAQAA